MRIWTIGLIWLISCVWGRSLHQKEQPKKEYSSEMVKRSIKVADGPEDELDDLRLPGGVVGLDSMSGLPLVLQEGRWLPVESPNDVNSLLLATLDETQDGSATTSGFDIWPNNAHRKRQFNSWGGKRTFNSWGGKRTFNSWGGKKRRAALQAGSE